ncbi:hypothetical protein ACEWY4_001264 [Coilia grayii]|uniref:C2H2-type domain-containing protein n=1 Tax=Coilia grayii TaxID=363190 RepID=A0ABD1KZ00_9TELE
MTEHWFTKVSLSSQQSSREDPCRLQVKEERHADMCWIQQTDTVRTDTTDAEGLQELPREPVAFRQLLLNLKLKEEHEERQEGQEEVRMRQEEEGRMAPGGSVRGDGQTQGGMHDWSGPQQWTLFAQEESNTDEDFLPLLPRIEQAIGYFHSNPISPENQGPPEMPLPPPTGSGTSVEAAGVSLTTHMAATPPQGRRLCRRPVVCLVCHQQLPSEVELVKHMRSHPGKRPYACSICGMHLAQKSSLRTHERLHSGLRPYRCPYCAKDYTLSHHLKRHMRTHLRDHATKDLRFYKDRPT